MEIDETGEKQINAVSRAIRVLEILSEFKSINLEQLAKETDLPKATLLRFLGTLCNLGYVYRDPHDLYSLTLKMFSVGSRSLEHVDLNNAARPIAEELAEQLGETVHMGIREDLSAIYVLKIESRYTIRMYSRVGKSIPLYCTAIGKMLLSDIPSEERKELLKKIALVPFTPNTIRTHVELEKELQEIARDGWSMDREEHEAGISCLCTPIRDYTGRIIAALSISWPMFRFDRARMPEYVQALKDATGRISQLFGYR
jgi:IclR family KDG regulon transcriptional repressor